MFRIILDRSCAALAALALVGLAVACSEQPVGPDLAEGGLLTSAARPPQCNAYTPLRITLADGAGDALQSDGIDADGNGFFEYEEGRDGGVHLSGNGELMFWIGEGFGRHVEVSYTRNDSLFGLTTTDRIYTVMQTHENAGGQLITCSLAGMADGSSGTAAFEVELYEAGFVRYGRNCSGARVDASRVATSRSGNTWTITGSSGIYCVSNGLKGKNAALIQQGTVGGFSMTLEAI